MDGKIYCITNLINGKKYVGKTVMSLAARWAAHRNGRRDSLLVRAIRKHGAENFRVEQIDAATTHDALNLLEQQWIVRLDCRMPRGYNLMAGGGGGGLHSPLTRAKLRALSASAEYKAKQKAGLRRFWDDPENRRRTLERLVEIRRKNYAAGKRHKSHQASVDKNLTPEWRDQRGALQKAIWQRPEYRAKLQRYLGDPEWREKRRLAVIEGLKRRKAARKEGSK